MAKFEHRIPVTAICIIAVFCSTASAMYLACEQWDLAAIFAVLTAAWAYAAHQRWVIERNDAELERHRRE